MPPERITVYVCPECGSRSDRRSRCIYTPEHRDGNFIREPVEYVPASDYEALEARLERARGALANAGSVLAGLLLADQQAKRVGGLRVHAPAVLDAMEQAEAAAREVLTAIDRG